jgi:hypothetical protein
MAKAGAGTSARNALAQPNRILCRCRPTAALFIAEFFLQLSLMRADGLKSHLHMRGSSMVA